MFIKELEVRQLCNVDFDEFMLLSLSTSLDLHFLLKNDKIFDELMSFIVLYIDIVLRSIVWLKI